MLKNKLKSYNTYKAQQLCHEDAKFFTAVSW